MKFGNQQSVNLRSPVVVFGILMAAIAVLLVAFPGYVAIYLSICLFAVVGTLITIRGTGFSMRVLRASLWFLVYILSLGPFASLVVNCKSDSASVKYRRVAECVFWPVHQTFGKAIPPNSLVGRAFSQYLYEWSYGWMDAECGGADYKGTGSSSSSSLKYRTTAK